MKNLNWIDKFIYIINILFSLLLLIGYGLRYFSPVHFPELASISLGLPVLLITNLFFVIYWLVKFKKQLLLSLIVLVIGYDVILSIFVIGNKPLNGKESFQVMSFNVRHFNIYEWMNKKDIPQKIRAFILSESPDIAVFQDFYEHDEFHMDDRYTHKFIKHKKGQKHNGLAIYSKYPFISTGSLAFPNTSNNIIYADILKQEDTLRIYNVHFESLKLKPDVNSIGSQDQKKLIGRMGSAFKKQVQQFQLLQESLQESPHPTIIAGDLNNTSYSYLYDKLIKEGFNDAFIERGSGYGKTFDFDFIPLRIDFILTDDKNVQVIDFKNHDVELSDHYPISADLSL